MKICYDLGFITIGVAVAMLHDTITILIYLCVSLYQEFFFKKSLKGVCTCHNCLNYGKVWTNSMRAFWKYFETKFQESQKQWNSMLWNSLRSSLNELHLSATLRAYGKEFQRIIAISIWSPLPAMNHRTVTKMFPKRSQRILFVQTLP